LLNASVIQNETSCLPSPCGRLSRPRTTTEAPPPSRLIGRDSAAARRPIRVIAILGWASLVPLRTLKRFRLDSDLSVPNSFLLLPQAPADDWLLRRPRNRRSDSPERAPTTITRARLGHSLSRARSARAASMLSGMGAHFPDGIGRFLNVVMRKLYLAGLQRLWSLACVPRCRKSCFASGVTQLRRLTS